jgi:tetratricopeptide (TPR) repeat protein
MESLNMRDWFKVYSLFFMLGLLVYFNSLNNKFLMDDYNILQSPYSSSMKFVSSQWNPYGEQALGIMEYEASFSYYRPMTQTLYDVSYAVFKNNFWQYHLFNLFLFVFAASLIYLLLGKLSGNYNLAFLTGLFYLIHPINGIAVNYISASVFALEVIFILGTILLLWESLERKNNRMLYSLSLLSSFLSLFWHESGMMIPFYVSAFIMLFRNDPFRKKALYLFPYFLIVFSYLVFRFFFVSINDLILKQVSLFHMTGWEHLATLFQLLIWYIIRLFYPGGIVMQWVTPVLHDHIIGNDLGACSLLLFFILLFIRLAKEKICQLAVVWVVIGFVPVYWGAFRMPSVGALIEPHWFIFSSIGFFILASYFFLIVLGRWKNAGLVLLFIVIFALGSAAHACNQIWVDQKTYARYWTQHAPHFKLAYFYLANAYQDEGAIKESREYYRMALTGYTSDMDIYHNLGMLDGKEGHWKEAELNFRRALSINPFSAGTYDALGDLYLKQGQWEKAKECFLQALVYNPLSFGSRAGLAYVYFNNSEYQKALDLCLKNLNLVDYDSNTLFLLVDIYIHKKDIVNIEKYAYRIIDHETDPETLMKLGVVMAQCNIFNVAIDTFIKVIRIAPDYKDAYFEAGKLLENSGKYDEAIHIWRLGSGIDPADQRFKTGIAEAVKLKLK